MVDTTVDLPAPAKELPVRRCRECNDPYRVRRSDQVFCGEPCKRKHFRRLETRGARALPLLLRWRDRRKANAKESKAALSELCHMVDGWIREDREAARS